MPLSVPKRRSWIILAIVSEHSVDVNVVVLPSSVTSILPRATTLPSSILGGNALTIIGVASGWNFPTASAAPSRHSQPTDRSSMQMYVAGSAAIDAGTICSSAKIAIPGLLIIAPASMQISRCLNTQDLGSCGLVPWGFKSLRPHHRSTARCCTACESCPNIQCLVGAWLVQLFDDRHNSCREVRHWLF